MTQGVTPGDEDRRTVGLPALTAMVVGSMIGSGVFLLPQRFGAETGVLGALIAWAIAGSGMLMLALVFQRLALRRPELDAGVYAYAKDGFGDYVGFSSAFGYWASACAGNTSYWVLITATTSALFPELGDGSTVLAVLVSSVGVWAFFLLIGRGVQQAAIVNTVATVAKVVPLLIFLVLAAVLFDADHFADSFAGGPSITAAGLWDQVSGTMLITVFVFLGVEGASMYSRYARRREDVGRATLLGFVSVLGVFALVTLVSYGAMPRADLAAAEQPSVASVLAHLVGDWGSVLIRVGVIVSVLGAYLAWTLMAAEILHVPAQHDDMPSFLRRTNAAGAPVAALLLAGGFVQVLLLSLLVVDDALDFMLDLTASLALLPYLLSALFMVRLVIRGDTYGTDPPRRRWTDLTIACLAVGYTAFLVAAAGIDKLLLSCVLYTLGTVLFVIARRERGLRVFRRGEAVLFGVFASGAVAAIVVLATGGHVDDHPDRDRYVPPGAETVYDGAQRPGP